LLLRLMVQWLVKAGMNVQVKHMQRYVHWRKRADVRAVLLYT
jgi:hypothetical protein